MMWDDKGSISTNFLHPLCLLPLCTRSEKQGTFLLLVHWGGTMKVTRVTIIDFKCQQKHMANLSYLVLHDRKRIFWGPPFQTCAFVYKNVMMVT